MWWKNLLITLIVTAFPLIYGNETTTALPTSPLPNTTTTSVTTSTNQVPTSATVVVTTTAITPNRENSSKPVSVLPSIRTDFLNTTSYACSCDLTVAEHIPSIKKASR